MHIEFFVEEESAERALDILVPKILGFDPTFRIHTFQGKMDLLKNLPARLKGYQTWLPDDWRIVVLIDEDRQDCVELKENLERAAHDAGLLTRSMARAGQGVDIRWLASRITRGEAHNDDSGRRFRVLNRLAVEELEAWFFGDVEAIVSAYPKVSRRLGSQERYRDPDAIPGGTGEALERVLKGKGYYRTGLPKREIAHRIAEHMNPDLNRSRSFQIFRDGLRELVTE